jgi:hypothetical protein
MPQIFKIGAYVVFFWTDEGKPLEPVHVHVSEGKPAKYATKIWITKSGKTLVANNNSKIQPNELRKLIRIIEANTEDICNEWFRYFRQIEYYC